MSTTERDDFTEMDATRQIARQPDDPDATAAGATAVEPFADSEQDHGFGDALPVEEDAGYEGSGYEDDGFDDVDRDEATSRQADVDEVGLVGDGRKRERSRGTAARRRRRARSSPAVGGRVHRVVKRRMVVRKLDPWSVLKLSLIFYFSLLLIMMLGLTVFWGVVNQVGAVETLLGFADQFRVAVTYDAGNVARAIFLIGLLNVVLFSAINVFLCFLYNLVADLIGGFRVTLAEEE